MSIGLPQTGVYTDIQGLTKLRVTAQQDATAALPQVAKHFEAYFIQQMLKDMRNTLPGDDLFGSDQGDFYRDMMDRQLSVNLAAKNSLGLADMMVRQLTADPRLVPRQQLHTSSVSEETPAVSPAFSASQLTSPQLQLLADNPPDMSSRAGDIDSPAAFVKLLWPHAVRAGQELGVEPRVLIAQSALETGWGKALSIHPGGINSHNLFNIKADGRWKGERVSNPTIEYENGLPQKRYASFRSYSSYAESMDDYVSFLKTNPRYLDALKMTDDADEFISKLAQAGYATDPAYASKIQKILGSDTLARAVRDLKQS